MKFLTNKPMFLNEYNFTNLKKYRYKKVTFKIIISTKSDPLCICNSKSDTL